MIMMTYSMIITACMITDYKSANNVVCDDRVAKNKCKRS